MSKMSDTFHKNYHSHHTKKAEIHAGHAEAHKAMLDHHEAGTPEHGYHKNKAELHQATHETHAKLADYHSKCMKAAGDELNKGDGALPASFDAAVQAAVLKMFGNVLEPSRISGVAPPRPGITMVPRPGQKEPEVPAVDEQFRKLVSVDNDEATN